MWYNSVVLNQLAVTKKWSVFIGSLTAGKENFVIRIAKKKEAYLLKRGKYFQYLLSLTLKGLFSIKLRRTQRPWYTVTWKCRSANEDGLRHPQTCPRFQKIWTKLYQLKKYYSDCIKYGYKKDNYCL